MIPDSNSKKIPTDDPSELLKRTNEALEEIHNIAKSQNKTIADYKATLSKFKDLAKQSNNLEKITSSILNKIDTLSTDFEHSKELHEQILRDYENFQNIIYEYQSLIETAEKTGSLSSDQYKNIIDSLNNAHALRNKILSKIDENKDSISDKLDSLKERLLKDLKEQNEEIAKAEETKSAKISKIKDINISKATALISKDEKLGNINALTFTNILFSKIESEFDRLLKHVGRGGISTTEKAQNIKIRRRSSDFGGFQTSALFSILDAKSTETLAKFKDSLNSTIKTINSKTLTSVSALGEKIKGFEIFKKLSAKTNEINEKTKEIFEKIKESKTGGLFTKIFGAIIGVTRKIGKITGNIGAIVAASIFKLTSHIGKIFKKFTKFGWIMDALKSPVVWFAIAFIGGLIYKFYNAKIKPIVDRVINTVNIIKEKLVALKDWFKTNIWIPIEKNVIAPITKLVNKFFGKKEPTDAELRAQLVSSSLPTQETSITKQQYEELLHAAIKSPIEKKRLKGKSLENFNIDNQNRDSLLLNLAEFKQYKNWGLSKEAYDELEKSLQPYVKRVRELKSQRAQPNSPEVEAALESYKRGESAIFPNKPSPVSPGVVEAAAMITGTKVKQTSEESINYDVLASKDDATKMSVSLDTLIAGMNGLTNSFNALAAQNAPQPVVINNINAGEGEGKYRYTK